MTQDPTQPPGSGRMIPLFLIAVIAVGFFALGGHDWINMESLRAHHRTIGAWVAERPVLSVVLYLLAYMLAVSAGIPLGALLMPLAGYLFGTCLGTSLAVVAATAGGALLHGALRLASAHPIADRLLDKAARFRTGFQRNPFGYLLLLRLVPVFPFFAVTIASVAGGVSRTTFVLATLLGLVPISFAWALLGADLGDILDSGSTPSSEDLLRPDLLLPLVLLTALAASSVLLRRWHKSPFRTDP